MGSTASRGPRRYRNGSSFIRAEVELLASHAALAPLVGPVIVRNWRASPARLPPGAGDRLGPDGRSQLAGAVRRRARRCGVRTSENGCSFHPCKGRPAFSAQSRIVEVIGGCLCRTHRGSSFLSGGNNRPLNDGSPTPFPWVSHLLKCMFDRDEHLRKCTREERLLI